MKNFRWINLKSVYLFCLIALTALQSATSFGYNLSELPTQSRAEVIKTLTSHLDKVAEGLVPDYLPQEYIHDSSTNTNGYANARFAYVDPASISVEKSQILQLNLLETLNEPTKDTPPGYISKNVDMRFTAKFCISYGDKKTCNHSMKVSGTVAMLLSVKGIKNIPPQPLSFEKTSAAVFTGEKELTEVQVVNGTIFYTSSIQGRNLFSPIATLKPLPQPSISEYVVDISKQAATSVSEGAVSLYEWCDNNYRSWQQQNEDGLTIEGFFEIITKKCGQLP